MKIEVRNGNVEKALRVMKKKLKNSGMMLELKERMYYSKPSEKKREAKKRGIKRQNKLRKEREQNM